MAEVDTVWNGHDNAVELVLTEEGSAIDHRNITRLQVMQVGDDLTLTVLADSNIDTDAFTFTAGGLTMALGNLGIASGAYPYYLNVFGVDAPHGIIWEPLRILNFVG